MRACEEYKKRVEERWEEPVRKRKVEFQRKCKEKKCRKLCLCCNKWFCSLAIVWYTVTEWVVRVVVKWVVYVVCRIVSSLITLVFAALALTWLFFCTLTAPLRPSTWSYDDVANLSQRPMRVLEVEPIIVDRDESTLNPITEAEVLARIADANRIFSERARIEVRVTGPVRRQVSASLYNVDAAGAGKFSEWLKGAGLLLGKNSPLHLTIYAVGGIGGAEALHEPFYGSVFIAAGNPGTTLAHEMGHALLGLDIMGHSDLRGNLMNTPAAIRENAVGWPRGLPTLTPQQWCSMRQSRWLNWSSQCEYCMGLDVPGGQAAQVANGFRFGNSCG